jgi:uncharacterized protein (TIRG00374 family)
MKTDRFENAAPRWKLWAKIAISTLILGVLLLRIDIAEVFRSLRGISPGAVALAVVLSGVAIVVAACKWRLLLPESPLTQLLKITFVRQFYALVLYGQVSGDLARVYLLGREGVGRYAEVTASVLFDRVTGFVGLMIVTAVALVLSPEPVGASLELSVVVLVIVTLACLALLQRESVLHRASSFLRGSIARFGLPDTAVDHLNRFLEVLHTYARNPGVTVLSIVVGAGYQLLCVGLTAVLAAGLGIDVSYIDLCWVFGVISLLLFLPISVGGLGVREGGFVGLLAGLGVAGDRAMALSLACFGVEVVQGLAGFAVHLSTNGRSSENTPLEGSDRA